eukprot:NODE_6460_length_845_cov_92.501385_g6224_i0.p1 GENE.NODE_6460_length_845_cov_92.501385_g6224_i0~~NODE_6460_length_845_cov_92.501385_g6224_i0.p1  ORF type:complete len:222 (+),score=30.93 NODE_6460_length_845_cov_92.501385_g6224_i0:59-724(+)
MTTVVFKVGDERIASSTDVVCKHKDSWFALLLEGGFHADRDPDDHSVIVDRPITPLHFRIILHYLATDLVPEYSICQQVLDHAAFFDDRFRLAILDKFPMLSGAFSIGLGHLYGVSDSSDFTESYACVCFHEYGEVRYFVNKGEAVWTKHKMGKCTAESNFLRVTFDDDVAVIFASPVGGNLVWHSSKEDSYRHFLKDPQPTQERMLFSRPVADLIHPEVD